MVTSTKIPLSSVKVKSGKSQKENKKSTIHEKNQISESISEIMNDKKFMDTSKIISLIFIIAFVITWILLFLLRPDWIKNSDGTVNVGTSILGAIIVAIFIVCLSYAIMSVYRKYY